MSGRARRRSASGGTRCRPEWRAGDTPRERCPRLPKVVAMSPTGIMPIDVWLPSEALATSAAHVRATGCDAVEFLQGSAKASLWKAEGWIDPCARGAVSARDTAIQVRSATLDIFVVLRRWSRRGGGTPAPRPPLHCAEDGRRFPSLLKQVRVGMAPVRWPPQPETPRVRGLCCAP